MTVRDIYLRWRVIYLTRTDIYLTGRDIYFEKGHNFVTNYWGNEILIMCTNPYSNYYIFPGDFMAAPSLEWLYYMNMTKGSRQMSNIQPLPFLHKKMHDLRAF